MTEQIAVVGTGTWGTTLAIVLAGKGLATRLWCRSEEEARRLERERENKAYLPGVAFPPCLSATASLAGAVASCTHLLLVVPAQTMRANVGLVCRYLPDGAPILIGTKGIELLSGKRMSEVVIDVMPEAAERVAVLSGPNLAREIAAGLPAASVVAAANGQVASQLRALLATPQFRVYTNGDVVGVELAGALKNVIAVGAGICDGLGLGDNAKAAFIGRGLLEIARLGIAAGALPLTFAGLAGLGDVIATCSSAQSRNRYVGEQIARGRPLHDVLNSMRMVAEGVSTTAAARQLARLHGVEMPIVEMMYAVLFEGKEPRQALGELMARDLKDEFAGIVPYR